MSWFTKLTRKNDWQYRLNSVFDHYENTDFIWGQTDCFCFASDCIKAMTGKGPMDGFKYLYDTEEQAYKFLDEGTTAHDNNFYRYNGIIGFWSSFLGEPKNLGGAMIGDITVMSLPNGQLITGVVNDTGRYVYLNAQKRNFVEIPIKRSEYIWGV